MYRRLILTGIGLLFVGLVVARVWKYATFEAQQRALEMPRPMANEEERRLYLSPDGIYTLADIRANGDALPSQKYRSFIARHDYNPRTGDRLCPITHTKANSECTWFIAGHEYQFCCPPLHCRICPTRERRPGANSSTGVLFSAMKEDRKEIES